MKINIEEIKKAIKADYVFCHICGETNPENGFYPMIISWAGAGERCVSNFLCNDCDKKQRRKRLQNDDN
jgi:hypothetical protein